MGKGLVILKTKTLKTISLLLVLSLSFVLSGCITITDPEEEAAKQTEIEKDKAEKEAKKAKENEERELAKKRAETLRKEEEKRKKEAEKKEISFTQYTPEDEASLSESFAWLMDESQGLITNIYPLNDDNYDVIYTVVVNDLKLLSEIEKEYFVDDWGTRVINQTIANLYGGDRSNPPHVYFNYEDGSALADPAFLGEGWKVK